MTHLDVADILLYAAVFFLGSIAALKNGEHATRPSTKQLADGVGAVLLIVGAVWLVFALVRTW